MLIDVFTSTLSAGITTFVSGLFLLIFWYNDRTAKAAFWMSLAECGMGIGITLLPLDAVLPRYLPHIVAPNLLDGGALLTFVASWVFRNGFVSSYPVIAAGTLWLVLQTLTARLAGEQSAAAFGVTISAVLYVAAAAEFWRGRGERIRGRSGMIGLLMIHAAGLFLVAIQFATTSTFTPSPPPVDWLGIIHLIGRFYGMGVTVFLIIMLKERSEAKHRATASIDQLTGLTNRRGFMNHAQQLFTQRTEQATPPISVLAFDLDRFKTVNDTYGHAMGDRVLQIFADVLARMVRSTDAAGRIGGEEFVAVLFNTSNDVAMAVAERIRSAFLGDARVVDGKPIGATVSIGVATSMDRLDGIMDVIATADAAMYRAKQSGRNRVIQAGADGYAATNVIRIA